MTTISPNIATTIFELLILLATVSAITYRFTCRISLKDDSDVPSEELLEAIRVAKLLDGDAIDQEAYDNRIRITRTILAILAAIGLALSLAEFAYIAIRYNAISIFQMIDKYGPSSASALEWLLAVYVAFSTMAGSNLWFSIVIYAIIAISTAISGIALLIIPQAEGNVQISFLIAHLCTSSLATIVVTTTSDGPIRQMKTPEGIIRLARLGGKGRSIMSMLWFTQALPIIKIAQKKGQIDENDCASPGSHLSARLLFSNFSHIFQRSKQVSDTKRLPTETLRSCWPLLRTLILANGHLIALNQSLACIVAVLFYAPYYTTFQILRYLEDQEKNDKIPTSLERLRFGLPYCLLFAVSILGQSLLMGQLVTIFAQWLRIRIRTQLNTAIFAKSLRRKDISGEGAKAEKGDDGNDDDTENSSFTSNTQVVNLVSVDSERAAEVHYLISFSMAPIEFLTGSIFVIKLLGWGAVIGFVTSVLLQPLILTLGKLLAKYETLQQATRDCKVTLLNEMLAAIRMIKFNAWERQTSEKVKLIREDELKYQKLLFIIEGIQELIFIFSPIIVVLVAYGWFTLVEKRPLTPSVAFTAMSVLQELRFALTDIPEGLTQFIQSLVSIRRIQRYLDGEEVATPHRSQSREVYIRGATIEWPRQKTGNGKSTPVESSFRLQDVDIDFVPNGLCLVVGKIGTGKTLLLQALLGEADVTCGQVLCPNSLPSSIEEPCPLNEEGWIRNDQCAYVPQTAFLINASLKDNVLFGLPMFKSRYEAVLDACGLLPDLNLLEDGDETEIGENGIGLSGGQKIRVTLARAAYSRGATVLLDDCLSAVDAHTADHIHRNLLKGHLFANRTVILVTHQVQLVAQSADQIIMLSEGVVGFQGDPLTFMSSDLYHGLVEDQEEIDSKAIPEVDTSIETTPATTAPPSPVLTATESVKNDQIDSKPNEAKIPRKLVEKETRAKGAVLLSIYARYISAAGGALYAVLLIASLVVSNAFEIVTSKWLQYWSEDVISEHQQHSNLWWLVTWAGLWALLMIFHVVSMILLYYGSLRASRRLYTAMLDVILYAPLRFHDTVSRGRLLNRFGYDFEEMDSEMADVFQRMGDQFVSIIVNVLVVASGGGSTFVILFAFMVPLYVIVGRLYMTAVRDMKRLASTTRSPILSTFSDVVSGVNVIRAFGASNHFFSKLIKRIELNAKFTFWTNELRWWFEICYTTFSFVMILIAAIVILLNPTVGAAQAGFIFSFLTNSNIHILYFLQSYADLEKKLVSVERIVEYTQLEQEGDNAGDNAKVEPVPAAWPYAGAVEIQDLRVRYAKELPNVLKGVTVSIPPGAKVGVVGPTGCGKSTLASSFFRFVEVTSGFISIDGIDTSAIPLKDLRSRLQIVPQDPIILSGPLRASVDVMNEFTDDEVRSVLKEVELLKENDDNDDAAPPQKGMYDLQHSISEGGGNLSNGEKQLLCLARAILKRSKLIIFDEATSSVDFDTDQLISQTIRRAFSQSTIITIAHRLRTIVDYDLVMVMDDGAIVEFDSPKELLSKEESRFYKLCRASGRRELAQLKSMAGL